jgi:hypothetical protein
MNIDLLAFEILSGPTEAHGAMDKAPSISFIVQMRFRMLFQWVVGICEDLHR